MKVFNKVINSYNLFDTRNIKYFELRESLECKDLNRLVH